VLVASTVPELASTICSCLSVQTLPFQQSTPPQFVAPAKMVFDTTPRRRRHHPPASLRKGLSGSLFRVHCLTLRVPWRWVVELKIR
jgi:hypothetical protein